MVTSYHKSVKSITLTLSLLLISLFQVNFAAAQDVAKGEKLFKGNCAACHKVTEQKLVGPGLKGISDRWPDKAKLHAWIKDSKAFLATGDAYANGLFNEYNKSVMPSQAVSDEDIDAILAYVANPPVAKTDKPVDGAPAAAASKDNPNSMLMILLGLSILFLVLISVLGGVRNQLARLVREKNGLPEPAPLTQKVKMIYWIKNNKKLIAISTLALVGYLGKEAWYGMKEIGVYTGYQPAQPINFSHKIHAGKNAINCVYCHSNVEKSKTSSIPSANVCMNCHKFIQEGPVTGKTEIAKIYAALDFDPNKGTYGPNQKPIQWVKVHALPDHVFFSHQQHVKVGQLDCANCHGKIAEMDTVKQVSPLTMGWCIDCHRKTEVKMEGNEYYKEIHAKLKEKYKGEPITVDKMGGIECGKCHY